MKRITNLIILVLLVSLPLRAQMSALIPGNHDLDIGQSFDSPQTEAYKPMLDKQLRDEIIPLESGIIDSCITGLGSIADVNNITSELISNTLDGIDAISTNLEGFRETATKIQYNYLLSSLAKVNEDLLMDLTIGYIDMTQSFNLLADKSSGLLSQLPSSFEDFQTVELDSGDTEYKVVAEIEGNLNILAEADQNTQIEILKDFEEVLFTNENSEASPDISRTILLGLEGSFSEADYTALSENGVFMDMTAASDALLSLAEATSVVDTVNDYKAQSYDFDSEVVVSKLKKEIETTQNAVVSNTLQLLANTGEINNLTLEGEKQLQTLWGGLNEAQQGKVLTQLSNDALSTLVSGDKAINSLMVLAEAIDEVDNVESSLVAAAGNLSPELSEQIHFAMKKGNIVVSGILVNSAEGAKNDFNNNEVNVATIKKDIQFDRVSTADINTTPIAATVLGLNALGIKMDDEAVETIFDNIEVGEIAVNDVILLINTPDLKQDVSAVLLAVENYVSENDMPDTSYALFGNLNFFDIYSTLNIQNSISNFINFLLGDVRESTRLVDTKLDVDNNKITFDSPGAIIKDILEKFNPKKTEEIAKLRLAMPKKIKLSHFVMLFSSLLVFSCSLGYSAGIYHIKSRKI